MADPIFKKDKVSQKFNLKEMFGIDLKDAPELRAAVGQAIIDTIRSRTENGDGIGGKPLANAKYSDEYADSIEFKAAGKNKKDVNMTLTGDMMALLDIVNETPNTIEIGWDDPVQNAKAFNHNTGDTVPKRQFFGLSKSEIKKITKELKPDVVEAKRSLKEDGRDAFTEKALDFLSKFESDDGED